MMTCLSAPPLANPSPSKLHHAKSNMKTYTSTISSRKNKRFSPPNSRPAATNAKAERKRQLAQLAQQRKDKQTKSMMSSTGGWITKNSLTAPISYDSTESTESCSSLYSSVTSDVESVAIDAQTLKATQSRGLSFSSGKHNEPARSGSESNLKSRGRISLASRIQESSSSDDVAVKKKSAVIEFSSEDEKKRKREKIKRNLKKLRQLRTGELSSEQENAINRAQKSKVEDAVKSKCFSSSTGRALRSATTEPEIFKHKSDSPTPTEDSEVEERITKKHKRKKRKRVAESDVLETDLDNVFNTEDEFEDPTAGENLYCYSCEELKNKDNFSTVQQMNGGGDRYCLLHTWTSGKITAKDYMDELDEMVAYNKRLLEIQEKYNDLNEENLGESDYEDDGWIIQDRGGSDVSEIL